MTTLPSPVKTILKITNTLSGEKEPLILEGEVRFYACGVTVYDDCHVGHARSAIVFDLLRNYLEYKGLAVRYIKNFTDIDDKIINRAAREGCDYKEIAERYITAYEEDMDRLRVRPPTLAPRATEHIPEMIALISDLLAKGVAYTVSGNVYFDVTCFPAYGKLSRQNMDQLIAGGRVENDPNKKNPCDFALWKAAKQGEPSWETPWGKGRPGWHLECSAMALKQLGAAIDLHGGGNDLIFPHHENEIAQSEAHTDKPLARYWIHHGHVTLNHEKMSKSLGNFFTIKEIFKTFARFSSDIVAEVFRFFILSTHYRSPIDFSDVELKAAKVSLDHFYSLFQKLEDLLDKTGDQTLAEDSLQNRFRLEWEEAMDDDLNTAKAIGRLHEFRSRVNTKLTQMPSVTPKEIQEKKIFAYGVIQVFKKIGTVLGLFHISPSQWSYQPWERRSDRQLMTDAEISSLIEAREAARQRRDWTSADAYRIELQERGVILEDRPDGTTRVKR